MVQDFDGWAKAQGVLRDVHGHKDDAVLTDYAQDFEPGWFRCALAALRDPEAGDLLIVGDGAQGLYRRGRVSW